MRDVPLVAQLAEVLREHRRRSAFKAGSDWVFATGRGTPLGHRNVGRRALQRAARRAGLDGGARPPLRFHDLRQTFASHLVLDLRLDPAQVSRILGHARVTITLDVYTHLFDEARHAAEIRAQMAHSAVRAAPRDPLGVWPEGRAARRPRNLTNLTTGLGALRAKAAPAQKQRISSDLRWS